MQQLSLRAHVAYVGTVHALRSRVADGERDEVGASVVAIMILVAAVAAAAVIAGGIVSGRIVQEANNI